MPQSNQCVTCKWNLGGLQCEAYPKGIPVRIVTGEHDHREPYPGDNGIRYEPLKGTEEGGP